MTDVSRGTSPGLAQQIFADRLPLAVDYAEQLATLGVDRGLIGPREIPRLWDRHILNSAVVLPRVPRAARVADVGTGAGLPGLVWAIARPDLQITLIEPLLRRVTFLEHVIAELGLVGQVRVLRSRAEDIDLTFDVVTARAVAALDKLAKWCLPLVCDGGVLLAIKGSSAPAEVEKAGTVLSRLGARHTTIATYGDLAVPTTVVEVTK